MSLPQDYLIYNSTWDYLVVLDSCRFDYFEASYQRFLRGELLKATSKACRTSDWLMETFRKPLPTMYYTANPTIPTSIREDTTKNFLGFYEVWKESWNEQFETVLPSSVNSVVKQSRADKMIIHYIQPHFTKGNFPLSTFNLYIKTVHQEGINVEILRSEYQRNLDLVLQALRELTSETDRKIIVTADHGEMLGEDQLFFHEFSTRLYHQFLREVPWLIVEQ